MSAPQADSCRCAAFRRVLLQHQGEAVFAKQPNHLVPRRETVYGDGPRVPLDREAKVRIMHLARCLKRRTEKGKHYGRLTGKFVDVLHAMLWLIHDARSGQCNPSYETIADKAGCCRDTVYEAIRALESAGILSWVQRIKRVREWLPDLLGRRVPVWRVLRISNAYVFRDPRATGSSPIGDKPIDRRGKSTKSEFPAGPMDVLKNNQAEPGQGHKTDSDTTRFDQGEAPPSEFEAAKRYWIERLLSGAR